MPSASKIKDLQSTVKALRKKLSHAESKIANLMCFKAQAEEQAKIIKRMEKKVAAYDCLLLRLGFETH
jgi:hypothetical protein